MGHVSASSSGGMEAVVDLRASGSFCEHFYLVVLEKAKYSGSILHMWKITISSKSGEQCDGIVILVIAFNYPNIP